MSTNEANAMEIYVSGGHRIVALFVPVGSVLVPLHTFDEVLAATGVACTPNTRGGIPNNLRGVMKR
jgi:hypothetical protein